MLFEAPKNTRLRHEWKHLITPADKQGIINRLSAVTRPDSHYGASEYHIRSLYFDNPYDKALDERLNGVEVREKFRIRYYNGDTGYIVLEKKSKYNYLCGKNSTRITKEECQKIIDGDIGWMLGCGRPLCEELYAKMQFQLLRPRVVVDYSRRAFVYDPGNVRVTLDDKIRSGLSATQMFEPFVTVPADIRNPIIMEVKYDAFCPEIIRDIVHLSDRHTSSFSKYAVCRLTNL
ncbi:MAG: polyphosphate polymerase domain-containing protein [Eubacteriales bacterium]